MAKSRARSHRTAPVLVAICILALALAIVASPAGAETPELPDSMAAIGDSITQATNFDLLNIGASNAAQSWSTGDDPNDGVASHYERILARNPGIAGNQANLAIAGRDMADAPRQAAEAVAHGADYVTVLIGANDVCAPSPQAMTSVADFESSFRLALGTLTAGRPDVRVLVASIPDIYQLWSLQQGDLLARLTWDWFKVCPTMLASANTEADRQVARARNVDFNTSLAKVCAEYARCRFDGNAVFNHKFTSAEVSLVDHFHPSALGLRNLAEITWQNGYWPGG